MKKILAVICSLMLALCFATGCGLKSAASSSAASTVSAQTVQQKHSKEQKQEKKQNKKEKKEQAEDKNAVSDGRSETKAVSVEKGKSYTDKDHVAAYIHEYGELPPNYITKSQARKLGWKEQGTMDVVAPGKSIGGDTFRGYESPLPNKEGRKWKECDIDYRKGNRNAKRLVFSNDGLIYYTGDHYKTFTRLY